MSKSFKNNDGVDDGLRYADPILYRFLLDSAGICKHVPIDQLKMIMEKLQKDFSKELPE